MITLYSGTPGSGKSLHQARDIYTWLRYGHPVIANFDIDITKIKKCKGNFLYLDNEQMTPQALIAFASEYFENHKFKEGKIRLYIDECQLLFNAREWQMFGRKEWLSFFTQHRKFGFDIYLVAQFDRMVDRQIRSLIEYEVIHRRADNYGFIGFLMGLLSGKGLFCAITTWYPLKQRLYSEFFRARPKYYGLYDTFNTFNNFGQGQVTASTETNQLPEYKVTNTNRAKPQKGNLI